MARIDSNLTLYNAMRAHVVLPANRLGEAFSWHPDGQREDLSKEEGSWSKSVSTFDNHVVVTLRALISAAPAFESLRHGSYKTANEVTVVGQSVRARGPLSPVLRRLVASCPWCFVACGGS